MSARVAPATLKPRAKSSPALAKTYPHSEPATEFPEPSPTPPPTSQTSQKIPPQFDWKKWYLTDEEDMGAGPAEDQIADMLRQVLITVCEERNLDPLCMGRDIFFAWVEEHPLVRVSPDVHLSDTPPINPMVRSIPTWKPGFAPPKWAVEVVSTTFRKDYQDNPAKYDQLGVQELVIFDPEVYVMSERRRKKSGRVPLQVYRRDASGHLKFVEQSEVGPVWCESIGFGVVVTDRNGWKYLRLTRDREGKIWVPTQQELHHQWEDSHREEMRARTVAEQKLRDEEQARTLAEQKLRAQEQQMQALLERIRTLEANPKEPAQPSKKTV